jgi:hypothetical protein
MQDAILNELLDNKYAEARDRFAEGQHSHEDLTIIMLKHQTNHIAHLDQDVRSGIKDVKDSLDKKIEDVKNSLHKSIYTLTWRMMLAMGLMTSVFTFIVKFQ